MRFAPPCLIAACLLPALATAEKNVLLIAGPKSHGPGQHEHPAGCDLLAGHLRSAGLGIRAEVSRGWPADPAQIAATDSLVLYSDGEGAHVAKGQLEALRKHYAAGEGLAVIHYALEPADPAMGEFLDQAIGGHFEINWSVNPIWKLTRPTLAAHPVTRGVQAFEIEEEFYYHIRLREGITPLLTALPPASSLGADGPRSGNPAVREQLAKGVPQTLAWVVENPNGSRGFGFTGGHFHHHWSNPSFRTLVLNAIAWTARVEVPEQGVTGKVAATPAHPTIDDAIAKDDIADVRLHLAANPANVNQGAKPNSRTPLEQAILRKKPAIAALLLEAEADPNTADSSRRTPLHLAVERNLPETAAALLKAGAKPDARDKDGWTPLHHAAAKNQVKTAAILLEGGANPMTLSELGGTPLHEAAASGGAEIIRLLLDHKVDPALKSKQGVTALDIARQFKNQAAIDVLSKL